MRPILLIVSDRPELFQHIELAGREVHCWAPERAPAGGADASRPGAEFAGDPTNPITFERFGRDGRDVVALLDFRDTERAARVAQALHAADPDAGLLFLCRDSAPASPAAAVARCVEWPDFLRIDLEAELNRLETQRRIARLRRFAENAPLLPILLQPDPDPDAISSALAVRALLRRHAQSMPIVSQGEVTRPENRRMAELLRVGVTTVTEAELRGFDRLIAVDTQPTVVTAPEPRLAVIDHHPPQPGYEAEFADIRPSYGATATMLTEYLRADDERRIRKRLATALLYGIKTDTASLSRGVTPADVRAYAFLQARADHELLHRIERPGYDAEMVRDFGAALAGMALEDDVAAAAMRDLDPDHMHLLADLGDFLIGMEGVRWAAAAAELEDRVVVKLRHVGDEPGAGELAARIAANGGSGGGHATMGNVEVPLRGGAEGLAGLPRGAQAQQLLELLLPEIRELEAAGAEPAAGLAAAEPAG